MVNKDLNPANWTLSPGERQRMSERTLPPIEPKPGEYWVVDYKRDGKRCAVRVMVDIVTGSTVCHYPGSEDNWLLDEFKFIRKVEL